MSTQPDKAQLLQTLAEHGYVPGQEPNDAKARLLQAIAEHQSGGGPADDPQARLLQAIAEHRSGAQADGRTRLLRALAERGYFLPGQEPSTEELCRVVQQRLPQLFTSAQPCGGYTREQLLGLLRLSAPSVASAATPAAPVTPSASAGIELPDFVVVPPSLAGRPVDKSQLESIIEGRPPTTDRALADLRALSRQLAAAQGSLPGGRRTAAPGPTRPSRSGGAPRVPPRPAGRPRAAPLPAATGDWLLREVLGSTE